MTPFERARQVYTEGPSARTFEEDLILHLQRGYVISTPEVFMMFRPVSHRNNPRLIVDPGYTFESVDCWHLYLAAGNVTQFQKHFPYPLPYISGERNNMLRVYRFRQIAEKVSRDERTSKGTGQGEQACETRACSAND